jgi:hypothetical protein
VTSATAPVTTVTRRDTSLQIALSLALLKIPKIIRCPVTGQRIIMTERQKMPRRAWPVAGL